MPIITSLLDVDFYKFSMGQFVFHRYADVPVRYAFNNRTSEVHLADFIDENELRAELDHARTLRFDNTELHYLRGTNEYGERMFKEDYLKFLKHFRLPDYELRRVDDTYTLEFPGKWSEAIYWETIALAIVNELYFRSLIKDWTRFQQECIYSTGKLRLAEKIARIKEYPGIKFSDFGTRRRFSKDWQDYVVGVIQDELPEHFLGTSNVELAMKHKVMPMGTSAHELFMFMAAIMGETDEWLLASQNRVLAEWWQEYGWGLSIAPTDTWSTDYFLSAMSREQAHAWKGLRQDSGDPFVVGEKIVRFYERMGCDPREKLLIFSDGLDVDTIVRLFHHFSGRIRVSFGWGTNLINDLGFRTLSLVVKASEAMGRGTVKLSDNIAKATGKPVNIARIKSLAGYNETLYEVCKS